MINPKFALDTNFVAPCILHGSKSKNKFNWLDTLIYMQSKNIITLSLPTTTQAEIYGVLRSGRMKRKLKNGTKVPLVLEHHEILKIATVYKEIFNLDYMNKLDGAKLDDPSTYKTQLLQEVKHSAYQMDIRQCLEYLRNKGIDLARFDRNEGDIYDLHIMVSSIKEAADYLVTTNIKDFPNPLGTCVVIQKENLPEVLPLYP
ncbi:hypothetical protein [Bacillus sp. AFS017336]|uniref:hypothetical protein n=1 Tax=Bacillus sp. AFS017336 TaxID=2033489 RepID=UPI000BF0BACB|nr:hypothetical protein [Bacillus sp. AFS017336]PEL13237.1 hypothetical protein CN601_05110 [Bacillus sp. AFS017336]